MASVPTGSALLEALAPPTGAAVWRRVTPVLRGVVRCGGRGAAGLAGAAGTGAESDGNAGGAGFPVAVSAITAGNGRRTAALSKRSAAARVRR